MENLLQKTQLSPSYLNLIGKVKCLRKKLLRISFIIPSFLLLQKMQHSELVSLSFFFQSGWHLLFSFVYFFIFYYFDI